MGYTLDPVGNRLARASTLAGVPAASYSYDSNDRLASDVYDANGNTRTRDGVSYSYDHADRLVGKNAGDVTVLYDGDGARVGKTVGGVATRYLVDELNPSGYSQVVEEIVGGVVERVYTHGSMLVSQSARQAGGAFATSYYGYDAHGNVTFLTDDTGAVTDRYTYDAFGNLVAQAGTTANAYLYGGQRFDADLGLYQLRARWYEPGRGRFLTRDPVDGDTASPISLNKYLYAHADPVNLADPTGLNAVAGYGGIAAGIGGQLAGRVLVIATATGIATIGVGVVSTLGERINCIFWRAWSGIEQLTTAASGTIAMDPPYPYQNCSVRLPRINVIPRAVPMPVPATPSPCSPCPAPPPPRIDWVPPSIPHYPCSASHIHTFVMNQNPKTCECFVGKGDVICL